MRDQAPTSWTLEAGEHVCWQTPSAPEYAAGQRQLAAHAARTASQLLIVGTYEGAAEGDAIRVLDVPARAGTLLDAVYEHADGARRAGRRLWVLAGMEHFAAPDAPLPELMARELDLAELAAGPGTSVVCAYQAQQWKPSVLGDLVPVHSRVMGMGRNMAGFWLRRARTGGWALEGSVGFESVRAFSAALSGALARSREVTLRCENLELIDAGGWRALVEAVTAMPGASVCLDATNETVRDAWAVSGYAATGVNVQVRA